MHLHHHAASQQKLGAYKRSSSSVIKDGPAQINHHHQYHHDYNCNVEYNKVVDNDKKKMTKMTKKKKVEYVGMNQSRFLLVFCLGVANVVVLIVAVVFIFGAPSTTTSVEQTRIASSSSSSAAAESIVISNQIDDDDEKNDKKDGSLRGRAPPAPPAKITTTKQSYKSLNNNNNNNNNQNSIPSKNFPYELKPVSPNRDFTTWSPPGPNRYAEYKNGYAPYKITPSLMEKSDEVARSRRTHIKNAMKHAWNGYKTQAFGKDEVYPQSGGGQNNWGGMGTTLVDALDTLWLMDLKDEFWEGRDWVRDVLNNDVDVDVSVFETTIRSLGGLLSAYDLSGDGAFLEKADDLGGRLFKAFDSSPSGIPDAKINLHSGETSAGGWSYGSSSAITAELGTLQVEFRFLAKVTGKSEYAKKAQHIFELMNRMNPENGLYPIYVNNRASTPTFVGNHISFGAMGDSLYEYMLKIWIQGGKKEKMYRNMWDRSIQGMHDELLKKSEPNGLMYIAEKDRAILDHKMDHLACYIGGALALGAYTDPLGLESERAQRDLTTARALAYTCYQMYGRSKTGISPEYVRFVPGDDFKIGHARYYILRPETVETFFILNVLTGDPIYREWGWEIFQAIEKYCKTKIAYGQLNDVNVPSMVPGNRMESFFLAETMKYLYLLQDPDTDIDILEKHVFNTEAHPLKMFTSKYSSLW